MRKRTEKKKQAALDKATVQQAAMLEDVITGMTGGESKFEKAALSSTKATCAVRELLGVSTPDTSKRPLRWRRGLGRR